MPCYNELNQTEASFFRRIIELKCNKFDVVLQREEVISQGSLRSFVSLRVQFELLIFLLFTDNTHFFVFFTITFFGKLCYELV